MGHDHHHESNESYFQEQLSTIALCGGFAAAAIVLYYWQRPILVNMGFQGASLFPTFIVWSGFALLVLVALRALTLWKAVGQPAAVPVHVHDHEGHEHAEHHEHHDHCHHDHDHGPEEVCHSHAASCGHDHGPSFWRYIVLLVPLILFFLGLPNKGPRAMARDVVSGQADTSLAPTYAAFISLGPLPLQQLVLAAAATVDPASSQVYGMDFKSLDGAALEDYTRKEWQGKMVKVLGQFARHQRSDRDFSLVRYRVQCCAADAVQYAIPALCRESVKDIPSNQWVEVTGQVHFQRNPRNGGFMTVLIVPRRKNITVTDPDPNPYIQ